MEYTVRKRQNAAKTDAYIDSLLSDQSEPAKPRVKRTICIGDMRLFPNTLRCGMDNMQRSRLNATWGKAETEKNITLTITILKHKTGIKQRMFTLPHRQKERLCFFIWPEKK